MSVVLPVYNQADFLEESVESVLSQKYDNLELIIVNDGSTDGVEKILDKYVSHPKIVVLTQENQKLPAALNTGLAHASGEFITWTSADNITLPTQLEEQVRFLRQNDFIQMVYCNYELVDKRGKPFERLSKSGSHVINTRRDIRSLNYTYNFIGVCFMYRSYVARIIGNYDPEMYGAEDYDYWMRVNYHFFVQHIGQGDSYYQYRLHGNTILGREGESAISRRIEKAQHLDFQRQSFFLMPMTLYVPKNMFFKKEKAHCGPNQPTLRLVQFESYQMLETLLSNDGPNEKTVLFLTKWQIDCPQYLSVLKRFKREKLLFSFAVLHADIASNRTHDLNSLDWIIVDAPADSYNILSGIYRNRLLCLSPWEDYIALYVIIANHHLFYKSIGKSILDLVPEHSVYK